KLEAIAAEKHGAKGPTVLIDAIFHVVESMDNPGPEDVVYAITDGGDNRSLHTETDLKKELLKSKVRICSLLLVSPIGLTSEEANGQVLVGSLVESSGGQLLTLTYPPKDVSGLA